MKQKCLACGVEKDTSVEEVYPFPEDGIMDDKPIAPLMDIECQGKDWRVVTVCHSCCHKLGVDMWSTEKCWLSLNPITPFEELPKLPT
jgi:hypothetical protein